MSQQRYPLSWPAGWRRTDAPKRRRAAFRAQGRALTMTDALQRLSGECRRLGATGPLLSTNVEMRRTPEAFARPSPGRV